MSNSKLEAIAAKAAESLRALMAEGEKDIQDAIMDAADGEKIRLSFAIVLDMEKNKQLHSLAWSVKHRLDEEIEIPDPDQPELFGEEGGEE